VVADDGRVTITDLYLHAEDITATTLRKISIARVRGKAAVYELLNDNETQGPPEDLLSELRAQQPTQELTRPRKPITRPDPPPRGAERMAFYKDVAVAYRMLTAATVAPIVVIAQEAGVSVHTAFKWVTEARRYGYLTPGRQRGI
jgi:hypothetical protein